MDNSQNPPHVPMDTMSTVPTQVSGQTLMMVSLDTDTLIAACQGAAWKISGWPENIVIHHAKGCACCIHQPPAWGPEPWANQLVAYQCRECCTECLARVQQQHWNRCWSMHTRATQRSACADWWTKRCSNYRVEIDAVGIKNLEDLTNRNSSVTVRTLIYW